MEKTATNTTGTMDAPQAGPFRFAHFFEWLALAFPHGCLVAALVWPDAFAPACGDLVGAIVLYFLGMLGFEVGLHRYYAHRSFAARLPLRIFLGICSCLAMQGPVLWWVWAHRHHHRHSDKADDLHSPMGQGSAVARLIHSHIGWHIAQSRNARGYRLPADLATDGIAVASHRAYYVVVLASVAIPCFFAYAYGGAGQALRALVWVGGIRMLALLHFGGALTSVVHLIGTRTYNTSDNSRNVWWLAIPTLGAAWHNNHHAFPGSATLWFRWWQVDLSYAFIAAMAAVGLARNVRQPHSTKLRGES